MSVPGFSELGRNFVDTIAGMSERRRDRENFSSDFGLLVENLEKAYSVDDAVFSLGERLKHAKAEFGHNIYPDKSTVVNGDLGDARIYLENLKYDPDHARSIVEAYHREHAWNPTSSRIGLAKIDNDLLINPREKKLGVDNYSHAVVKLAHGMAKLKLLVENGERGIPEAYPAARDVVASELAIVEKAASIIGEWDRSWGTPSVDRAISLASKKLSLDSVLWRKKVEATGLIAGALALAACSAAMPTESKPNLDPAIVATPMESGRTELETPVPGMSEFESSVPATMEAMSIPRLNELREKFLESQVVGYQEQTNPSSGAVELNTITLSAEYKAQMQLRDGIVLSEPGGGQWECLFYEIVYGDISEAVMACNVEGGGMFIPYRQIDSNRGLVQWNFFADSSGNYPVSTAEAAMVRPVMLLEMTSGVDISRGWMWSPKDGKLHEIKDAAVNFKNAAAFPITNRYAAEETLEDEYGSAAYTWPADGKPTLTFDNGMVFEWDGAQYVQVENDTAAESAPMSELDQQIFKAAPDVEELKDAEGIKEKVWNDVYGTAVYLDESGEVVGYWVPNRFNKDRGVFKRAVMIDGVMMVGEEGKEKAVWPVKAKMELPGNKFDGVTIYTSAENWKNNPTIGREDMADMSAYLIALIEDKQIRGFAEGAVQLGPKMDENGKTYYDYVVGEDYKLEETVAKSMIYPTTSSSWEEQEQRPFTPAVFPASEYDGLLYMPQMFLQADNKISNVWYQAPDLKGQPVGGTMAEIVMEYFPLAGGNSMLLPAEYRNAGACKKYGFWNEEYADEICVGIMADQPTNAALVKEMIKDGYVPLLFSDGTAVFTVRFSRIPGIQ